MNDKQILELKTKAEYLLQEIERWIENIGSRRSMEHGLFNDFMTENHANEFKGLSYSSLSKARAFVKETSEKPALYLRSQTISFEMHPHTVRINRFLPFAKEFCKKVLVEEQESNPPIRCWHLYFLAVGPHKRGYPKLGRGLLILQNNKVTLKVPDERPNSPDYEGTIQKLNDNIYFFNLEVSQTKNPKQRVISKVLHIKINCGSLEDEYVIGSYNTYDKRIYTGSVILEKVKAKNFKEMPLDDIVSFMSLKENSFEYDNISNEIKEYLSSKRRNITKAPKTIIQNKDGLKHFLENNRSSNSTRDDVENKFLEPSTPIIFIASPQTSIGSLNENNQHQDSIESIVEKLKKEFDQCEVHTENTIGSNPYATDYLSTLRALEKTRYFILILPETRKLSYSVLQLGWAMQVSKYVLFMYSDGKVSNRLKNISYQNDNFTISKRDFSSPEGWQEVYDNICGFIHAKKFDKSKA